MTSDVRGSDKLHQVVVLEQPRWLGLVGKPHLLERIVRGHAARLSPPRDLPCPTAYAHREDGSPDTLIAFGIDLEFFEQRVGGRWSKTDERRKPESLFIGKPVLRHDPQYPIVAGSGFSRQFRVFRRRLEDGNHPIE